MPNKIPNNDSIKVVVGRNDKRVARLREHLCEVLPDLKRAKKSSHPSPVAREPDDFRAVVARTACSLCRGYCCRNGDDDAFLDDRTLARVRVAHPKMTDQAVVRLYVNHVPLKAYGGSCIFHGKKGCTLERSLRSDVCNTYFCRDLGAYIGNYATPKPTVVIAGGNEKSPLLRPRISLVRG